MKSRWRYFSGKTICKFVMLFLWYFDFSFANAMTMLSLSVSIPRALQHNRHKYVYTCTYIHIFVVFFLSLFSAVLESLPSSLSVPACSSCCTSHPVDLTPPFLQPSAFSFLHLYIFTPPVSVFPCRILTPATINVAPLCEHSPKVPRGCWSDEWQDCGWKTTNLTVLPYSWIVLPCDPTLVSSL